MIQQNRILHAGFCRASGIIELDACRELDTMRRARPPNWPRLMTATLACAYLGNISAESFARFVASRVRAVRWPGEQLLYDRADLDRWLDEGAPNGVTKSDEEWLAEFEK